jgi:hypothetical protein
MPQNMHKTPTNAAMRAQQQNCAGHCGDKSSCSNCSKSGQTQSKDGVKDAFGHMTSVGHDNSKSSSTGKKPSENTVFPH